MALPRALPRSIPHYDSFYSGINHHENDWRQLEDLDPESPIGIHVKYPIYEYAPVSRPFEWQQERQFQQLQQQYISRQFQYPGDDENESGADITARHRRQQPLSQAQRYQQQYQQQQQQQLQQQQYRLQKPLEQRQLVSPPPTFVEKEKKSARFSSRFSFLTRRRQGHQRHESMPAVGQEVGPSAISKPGHARIHSLTVRPGNQAALVMGFAEDQDTNEYANAPASKSKNNGRVKQMFKDVFGMTRKKSIQSPEFPFRNISLPSTHVRTDLTPSPHSHLQHRHQQHYQHQHKDHSMDSQYLYSTTLGQRKGLVTPVSRPDTAQSNYFNHSSLLNNNNSSNSNNLKTVKNPRESLVDPIQPQQLAFSKMELEDDDIDLEDQDPLSMLQSPFGQTSLTPPPASSVLRHSTSTHRIFNNFTNSISNINGGGAKTTTAAAAMDGEFEPILISSAATITEPIQPSNDILGGRNKARRSSQLMPILKDFVDSGCDSMGGHEPYATASNATTLNHPYNQQQHQQQQQQNQQQPYQQTQQLQSKSLPQQQTFGMPSYDYDRDMDLSIYDNGPTIVAMAQVQKVDLEGLRQNHHHHSPPTHSHLSMVAVEAPFA
ncbi:hypothetical protein EDD11_008767 [Mortierella claussenii]|nr:hypothetical protein EDD11_008767 [Mortierella claussenii]